MNQKYSLKDILLKDAANAKTQEFVTEVLDAGDYVAKVLGFTEEDTYQYITLEIDGKKHNFFYDYFIYGTQDLNADVINWIKHLATCPIDENTSLLTIANSAIGFSYKIEIYNYTSKKGKNAGKKQHAIQFRTLPIQETVAVVSEEIELPF